MILPVAHTVPAAPTREKTRAATDAEQIAPVQLLVLAASVEEGAYLLEHNLSRDLDVSVARYRAAITLGCVYPSC